MYNIDLLKIYLFTYLNCLACRVFLQNLVPGYKVPHFAKSFQPINGWDWETSIINLELIIKLYSIKLIAQMPNSTIYNVLFHILLLEGSLLVSFGSSSFVLHGLVSAATYMLIKNLTYVFGK